MLNKGPFIVDAISALSEILHRIGGHNDKKRDMLRDVYSWHLDTTGSHSAKSPNLVRGSRDNSWRTQHHLGVVRSDTSSR